MNEQRAFNLIFADRLLDFAPSPAVVTPDGREVTYEQLATKADAFAREIGPTKRLLLVQTTNELEPLVAYLGALRARQPTILCPAGSPASIEGVLSAYEPDASFCRDDGHWNLKTGHGTGELHEELALLLSTSGSTGNAKRIRDPLHSIPAARHAWWQGVFFSSY